MADNGSSPEKNIHRLLGSDQPSVFNRRIRWLVAVLIIVVVAITTYSLLGPSEKTALRYVTADIERGNLIVTVTATGTVQPVNQVDVGSELSGTIESVHVDFNDRVKRDQVLARLDTDRLKAQVIEARASLESAQAKREEARATVVETRMRYKRCEKLVGRKLCSQEDLDTTRAAYLRAQAVEASSKAQVTMAEATLEAHETDLGKAEIRSPIDGLVLRRQIEPGQTVAASLQAPVLFTLAEDLTHMELHVAVDEADVGKIAENQVAQFTVDAYPERRFPASITQVRYAPQTVEGVVTYETVLSVDNADMALRPGMTATAVVTVAQLENVLLVPNAALRFSPPVTRTKRSSSGGIFGALMFRRHRSDRKRPATAGDTGPKVWVLRNNEPVAISIKTGASDGKYTELKTDKLQPGDAVITDAASIKK